MYILILAFLILAMTELTTNTNKGIVVRADLVLPPENTSPSLTTLLNNSEAFFHSSLFNPPLYTLLPDTMLIKNAPISDQQKIVDYAKSTKILVSSRLLPLIQDFLTFKQHYGSSIEISLYQHMTPIQFIQRLFIKRPLTFMTFNDFTKLRNGMILQDGRDAWDRVGTEYEFPYLSFRDYLSYDEMTISALIGVSSFTHYINDGHRYNNGEKSSSSHLKYGVLVGLVGPRFEREYRMESLYLIEKTNLNFAHDSNHNLNSPSLDYHKIRPYRKSPKFEFESLQNIWSKFYDSHHNNNDNKNKNSNDKKDRVIKVPLSQQSQHQDQTTTLFNVSRYKFRIQISLETLFMHAHQRGIESNQKVHVNIVGLGLGVWSIPTLKSKQIEWYIEATLDAYQNYSNSLLSPSITPTTTSSSNIEKITFAWIQKPENLSINLPSIFHFAQRNPASIDPDIITSNRNNNNNILVVCTYAWDGNSFPGNEVWIGSLNGSGDPAAIVCSNVGELQNPYINPAIQIEIVNIKS